jgi:hypothetical protein
MTGSEVRERTAACIPLGLRIRAHALGNAVDVVEVPDHLDRVVNRLVVEAVGAQRLRVVGADGGRGERQLDRVVAQRTCARVEVGRAIVVLGV